MMAGWLYIIEMILSYGIKLLDIKHSERMTDILMTHHVQI